MKKLTVLLTVLVILLSFFIFNIITKPTDLISPILSGEKVLGLNQWFPSQVLSNQANAPQITAKAGFFITPESKALVYLESDPSPGFLKAKYLLNQKSIFYIAHINKFKGINKLKYKVKDVSVEGHDAAYLLGIIFAKGIITRNFIYFPLYQEEETSLKIKELLTKLGIKFLAKKKALTTSKSLP